MVESSTSRKRAPSLHQRPHLAAHVHDPLMPRKGVQVDLVDGGKRGTGPILASAADHLGNLGQMPLAKVGHTNTVNEAFALGIY